MCPYSPGLLDRQSLPIITPVPLKYLCVMWIKFCDSLQWRHNEYDGISIHRRFDCLLNRMLRRRSNKKSKLRVTGLCEGNSSVTSEFPAQRASDAENVSIWWRNNG